MTQGMTRHEAEQLFADMGTALGNGDLATYYALGEKAVAASQEGTVAARLRKSGMTRRYLDAMRRMAVRSYEPEQIIARSAFFTSLAKRRVPTDAEYRELAHQLAPLAELSEHDCMMFAGLLNTFLPTGQNDSLFQAIAHASEWGACGCPTIRLTEKQAAAFAFSDLGEAELREWRMPWPAFVVLVPPGIFGADFQIDRICIHQLKTDEKLPPDAPPGATTRDGLLTMRVDNGIVNLWSHDRTVEKLYEQPSTHKDASSTNPYFVASYPVELTSSDERVLKLCARIVLNTVVEASVPSALKPARVVKQRKRGKRGKRRNKVVESKSHYELDREIKIDVTRYVRDFASNDSNRVYKCRWVVRGHRRHQACGKGWKERKWVYIEPHAKGRHDLPMSHRVHTIEEADGGSGEA